MGIIYVLYKHKFFFPFLLFSFISVIIYVSKTESELKFSLGIPINQLSIRVNLSFFSWFFISVAHIPSQSFQWYFLLFTSHKYQSTGFLSASLRMLVLTIYTLIFHRQSSLCPSETTNSYSWLIPGHFLLKSILLCHQNCFSEIDLLTLTAAPKF